MNFPSIDIQGSVISAELLGKIRSEQVAFQQGRDFNQDFNNLKLKDEISLVWQEAKSQWSIFKSKMLRVKTGETATTETRNFWILPLLSNLGYNLAFSRSAEELNGKSFPISYRDTLLDNFPVIISGFNESLDKRPDSKYLRVSPHALLQEYLNYSEHLFGLVTNGRQLRLLRDATRLTRLSYVEFNLEKIMEEDLYSDFVIFYRLLHISRMPQKMDAGAESIIEKYHQEGLEAGATIRSKLGNAVKNTIKALANGFVNHPDNSELRAAISKGNFDSDEYYRQQLRIIYRLLFLFVIEERNLVYAESKEPQTKRFNQIYYKHYSLLRLRKLAKRLPAPEANRHYDLWMSLVSTFALFESKYLGEKLGIMSLQGDLFSYDAISANSYDLHKCRLSNAILLQVIKALGYFENENKTLIAVNYGGLDVEEFGSVYEGLLELKLKIEPIAGTDNFSCSYEGSEERSKSGSHYTPDELVQPLIKHSLDYLLDDRKKLVHDTITKHKLTGNAFRSRRQELVMQHIFTLKVCDVACGSGHLLISGARRIAEVAAAIVEEEEQPNPRAFQAAKRTAILNCIYGVDKNPLAVELCKVALWLEAYIPGQPLNFLDHHIKCGDAIVGLAHRDELENGIPDEAFKALTEAEKENNFVGYGYEVAKLKTLASVLLNRNKTERQKRVAEPMQIKADFDKTTESSVHEAMVEYKTFNKLPETTAEDIERKAKAYNKFIGGKGYTFLKAMADTLVAQFFIPKTSENKDSLMTDEEFRTIMKGFGGWQNKKTAKAIAVASELKFFHWFLEFPEVFQQGGFDCIIGNPPFLGYSKISGNYGLDYLEYLKLNYQPARAVDLVTYFFRRDFNIIKLNGFISLISTNTIAQGSAREVGLEYILKNDGSINFAIKSIQWPGIANVQVSLVTINKSFPSVKNYLNNMIVNNISSYLDDNKEDFQINNLFSNNKKSFLGSYLLGTGFNISKNEADILINKNNVNKGIIFPYLTGDDVNTNPNQISQNYAINFFEMDLDTCKNKYPDCFQIIEERVKPEREKQNDKRCKEKWWIYKRPVKVLYECIKDQSKVLIGVRISKYTNFCFVDRNQIFSDKTIVYSDNSFFNFLILQSSIHENWAWKLSSTLGSNTLIYSPSECYETFPYPRSVEGVKNQNCELIGEQYHEHRKQLMLKMQLGLTKTYNAFHAPEVKPGITKTELQGKDKKVVEKQ
nr:restriction endonuclease [Bacteroidales bacterium]